MVTGKGQMTADTRGGSRFSMAKRQKLLHYLNYDCKICSIIVEGTDLLFPETTGASVTAWTLAMIDPAGCGDDSRGATFQDSQET